VPATGVPGGVVPQGTDGATHLLCCFRARPFTAAEVDVVAEFAVHVTAALVNAGLRAALAASESSLRLVADSISDMVAVVDTAGRYVYASPSHDRELGQDATGLVGESVTGMVHPADRRGVEAYIADPASASRLQYRQRSGAGEWVWVESVLRTAPDDVVVLASRVIEDRRRLEDELRRRTTHDALTGLANRALGTEWLAAALTGGRTGTVGVLFCGIDKFTEVNDRLGHEAGDELLVHVADRLRGCIRRGDLLCRFGGDEFVVVLDNPRDTEAMAEVATRMVAAIAEPLLLRGERVQVTTGIGGAFARRGSTSASAMLRDADSALHTAKRQGRGQVRVFDEAASVRSRDRLEVSSNLGAALARGELSLHYQPIVELDGQRLIGFEALARWKHPTRGFIPPDVFIPIAEDTGAILEIGDWVLGQASRQLAAWRTTAGDMPMRMNVNLSPVQIEQPDAADRALRIIRDAGAAPADVWLEVTEQRSIGPDVAHFTNALRTEGVHFALDDFGTSYSNLGHLDRLPVEELKIDRSFVDAMTAVNHERGMVRAVLAIAESLGLSVVAEGIETPAQLDALIDLGCGHGQGYLFSKPVPAEQADQMVSDLRDPGASA
jgi:diguanylate cyclase (GGDEF)-like protein/PAS domain S-box-containing protein